MNNGVDPPTCPNCHKQMTLVRVIPKVASLPELNTFKCGNCAEVLSQFNDAGRGQNDL